MSSEKQTKKHSIGATIAKLRKIKGWTQAELAEKLNVSDKAVSKWEQDLGTPSIEFLAPLAGILGISTDYLLTGEIAQPKQDGILNLEYMCSNDDPEVLEHIDGKILLGQDKDGKTILDYLSKYDCEKVAKAFFDLHPAGHIMSKDLRQRYPGFNRQQVVEVLVKYMLFEELDRLMIFYLHFLPHDLSGNNSWRHVEELQGIDFYSDEIFGRVFTEDKYKGEFLDKYLEYAGSYQYEKALAYAGNTKNAELFKMLWNRVLDINVHYYETRKKLKEQLKNDPRKKMPPCCRMPYEYDQSKLSYIFNLAYIVKNDCFLVDLDKKFLRAIVVNCGYIEAGREYNRRLSEFTDFIIPEEWFTLAALKASGKGDTYEAIRLSVMDEGLLNLEKLNKIEDYDTAKKLLFEEPITELELACWNNETKAPDSGKFNELYDEYSDWDRKRRKLKYLSYCSEYSYFRYLASNGVNDNYLKELGRIEVNDIDKNQYSDEDLAKFKYAIVTTAEEALELIKKIKEEYFRPRQEEHDRQVLRQKLTQRYPRTYFKELLEKGDVETAVVKLCVLLEGLLTTGYNYEGDLADMISKYCEEHNVDDETRDLLHKLRTLRNSYVHPIIENVDLTEKEILKCIELVFNIAK